MRRLVAIALSPRPGRGGVTADQVHEVAFRKPRIGSRGYDEDEVDAFLDLVEGDRLGDVLSSMSKERGVTTDELRAELTAPSPAYNPPCEQCVSLVGGLPSGTEPADAERRRAGRDDATAWQHLLLGLLSLCPPRRVERALD